MDVVVIILVLGALAVLIFKRFGSFVYYVAFVDIFLRLIRQVNFSTQKSHRL